MAVHSARVLPACQEEKSVRRGLSRALTNPSPKM